MIGTSILAGRGAAASVFMAAAGGLSGSAQIEWVGPFAPGQVMLPGSLQAVTISETQTITVPSADLQAIAASDPDWWGIV